MVVERNWNISFNKQLTVIVYKLCPVDLTNFKHCYNNIYKRMLNILTSFGQDVDKGSGRCLGRVFLGLLETESHEIPGPSVASHYRTVIITEIIYY